MDQTRLARASLAYYGAFAHGLKPAAHHWRWIDYLHDPAIERLLIIAPPGHAKSTWCSVLLPCWYIGNNPEHAFVLVSGTDAQARKWSLAVRDTVEHNETYRAVFPSIRPDYERMWQQTAWQVGRDNRARPDPTFFASGVGGPILGARAELIVVDDPLSEEDARSAAKRQFLKDWTKRTLLPRLMPGGRIVVILTRWCRDDLAEELMKPELGFVVLHMPSLGYWDGDLREGQALWPQRFSQAFLLKTRAEDPRAFETVYQGNPVPEEGAIFQRSWWQYYENLPPLKFQYQSWDTAYKKGQTNDYSACVTFGLDAHYQLYLVEAFRAKLEFPELVRAMVAQYQHHHSPDSPVAAVLVEEMAMGRPAVQSIKRESLIPVVSIPVIKHLDKVARANAVTPYYREGRVWHPKAASWLGEYELELEEFPGGAHDDWVDATSQGIGYIGGLLGKGMAFGTAEAWFSRRLVECPGCGAKVYLAAGQEAAACPQCSKEVKREAEPTR